MDNVLKSEVWLSNGNDFTCSDRIVCRCLRVTEGELVAALQTLELRTLKDVRRRTGAGDGCTACHKILRRYLESALVQA